jgi:maltooligosyltrehalose trehalohydrolase
LKTLGITAIELMPIAQFPGQRNWGYDGVDLFAVQNSYGSPEGLKRLVDACHREHLAVILDVVYNHLGPEGNHLPDFGPYFTDKYKTPWGPALNFDGPQSDEVRRFFIENALYWVSDCHIDGLRLDAIHAIHDQSAYPFLAELSAAVHARAEQLERQVHLIAESDLNDMRVVQRREQGGLGLDAQWSDDFHHALHVLLTGERSGYYQDFGSIGDLAGALRDGWVYAGRHSSFRQRRHGNDPRAVPADQFVVCAQNHDQVGNRMRGDRLSQLASLEGLKLAAGVVLLSPFLPLLFAGEEYGERAPFLYFVSHESPELVEAVRRGRREEFAAFAWQDEAPDPQDEQTFLRSKLDRGLATREPHRTLLAFYRELLRMRREVPALARLDKNAMEVVPSEEKCTISVRRWAGADEVCVLFGFGQRTEACQMPWRGDWRRLLDSADTHWAGPGGVSPERVPGERADAIRLQPQSFVLYLRDN